MVGRSVGFRPFPRSLFKDETIRERRNLIREGTKGTSSARNLIREGTSSEKEPRQRKNLVKEGTSSEKTLESASHEDTCVFLPVPFFEQSGTHRSMRGASAEQNAGFFFFYPTAMFTLKRDVTGCYPT